jgi:alcohol dehydrogenase
VLPFDYRPLTRVVLRAGGLSLIGDLARDLGCRRALLVSDHGIVRAGFVARALRTLTASGVDAIPFHDFDANPDTDMVERGRVVAAEARVDSLIAVGGGSSLDCAKGINFVLTNGGNARDYRGHGKATRPMLPMIAVPTTAGTGSEVQTNALISDAVTHEKMACGDAKAAFKIALLDPELTLSQPRDVTAIVGYDALSHAVESFVTTRRTDLSDVFAREAWRLLRGAYERVLDEPADLAARSDMLLGSCLAGLAIEQSMLGATHACANPLTARYGTTHGIAIAVMLPHVVRWNGEMVGDRYGELLGHLGQAGQVGHASVALADDLARLARVGRLPRTLRDLGVERADLSALAELAAPQWTGTFNPRPFDARAALTLYQTAY